MNYAFCNLKKWTWFAAATMALAFMMNGQSLLAAPYAAITDYTSYTGSITAYNSLADAQAGVNAAGTFVIPDRATDPPSDTAYRDFALYIVNDYPSIYADHTQLGTAWYYTTVPGNPQSGHGNPNNTNAGFLQIADAGSTTVTSGSGVFSNLQGGVYTDYRLHISGAGANASQVARLWPAATNGAAAATSGGIFHSYELDVTFGGLDGQLISPGIYHSDSHPTSVDGTFNALFENTSAGHEMFYTVDLTFDLDNWAVAQSLSGDLNGTIGASQFIGTVPEPGTIALAGIAGLAGVAMIRRRRRA